VSWHSFFTFPSPHKNKNTHPAGPRNADRETLIPGDLRQRRDTVASLGTGGTREPKQRRRRGYG